MSGIRREIVWSILAMKWWLNTDLARDSLGLGRGSRWGSCIFWVLGMFQVLEGSRKRDGIGWS